MAKAQQQQKKFVFGLDVGYSNVKMVYGYVGDTPVVDVRPAQAAPLNMVKGEEEPLPGECLVYIDGAPWLTFISPDRVAAKRELHADYTSSEAYKALFLGALTVACQNGEAIDVLVTGLPVNQYLDKEHVESLTGILSGRHKVAPESTYEVRKVVVLAQPVGTMFDIYSVHEDAELFSETNVLVLDPGFFSVDWVLFQSGSLHKESSGTALEAMSTMVTQINSEIQAAYGGQGPGLAKIEAILQAGKDYFVIHGRREPIAKYIEQAAAKVAPEALKSMKQQLRYVRGQSIDFILLGGGGSNFYKQAAMEIFPEARLIAPENAVVSNARGFWLQGNIE